MSVWSREEREGIFSRRAQLLLFVFPRPRSLHTATFREYKTESSCCRSVSVYMNPVVSLMKHTHSVKDVKSCWFALTPHSQTLYYIYRYRYNVVFSVRYLYLYLYCSQQLSILWPLGVFRYIWQQLDMKLSYLLYCNLKFCLWELAPSLCTTARGLEVSGTGATHGTLSLTHTLTGEALLHQKPNRNQENRQCLLLPSSRNKPRWNETPLSLRKHFYQQWALCQN